MSLNVSSNEQCLIYVKDRFYLGTHQIKFMSRLDLIKNLSPMTHIGKFGNQYRWLTGQYIRFNDIEQNGEYPKQNDWKIHFVQVSFR